MTQIIIGAIGMLLFILYSISIFYLGRRFTPKSSPASTTKALSPEQLEAKRKREQLEEQFNRVFTYKR